MSYKLKYLGGVFGFLVFMSVASFAALELTVGTVKDEKGGSITNLVSDIKSGSPVYYLDSYHYDPFGSDPRVITNRLKIAKDDATQKSDPGIIDGSTIDYNKYVGYITPDDKVYFLRFNTDSSPGGSVYIRVWSGAPNTQGSYYSRAQGFANGSTSLVKSGFGATTDYKADAPETPIISAIESKRTTNYIYKTQTVTTTLFSQQPDQPKDGKREVVSYLWEVLPAPLGDVNKTGSSIVFNPENLMTGEVYTCRVQHTNWFGSSWSSYVSFEAGKDISLDGQSQFDFTLRGPRDNKLIVNSIAIPANDLSSGKKIYKASDLANFINEQVGSKVVTAISRWDPENGKALGATFDAGGALVPGSVDFDIVKGVGYQVYLTGDHPVTFK